MTSKYGAWLVEHEAEIDALRRRAEAAEKALAEVRKDSERLDWLSAQKYGAWGPELFAGQLAAMVQLETGGNAWKMGTLRAAIDAAREGK